MLLPGVWLLNEDGIVRPTLRGEIQATNGRWVEAPFLLDTGADRTVISAAVLGLLEVQPIGPSDRLGGVGGPVDSVVITSPILFTDDNGAKILFRGPFAAFTREEALDTCVVGRDITNHFAAIVDRPRDVVCLLGYQHQYTITHR
jgi:hypothetical protein